MHVTIYDTDGEVSDALATGFHARGDEVDTLPIKRFSNVNPWTHMAVVIGLGKTNAKIYKAHLRAGKHMLLVDRGYIAPDHCWRFALDGFQSRFLHKKDNGRTRNRLDNLLKLSGRELRLRPNFEGRQRALYLGMDQDYCDWHKLGVNHEFDSNNIRPIVREGSRHFTLKWYPGFPAGTTVYMPRRTELIAPDKDFREYMKQARVVISHGHRGLIDAMLEGIPIATLASTEVSPCWEISVKQVPTMYLAPAMPEDQRLRTLINLAWNEFTITDITSGWALSTLEPYTIKGLGFPSNPDERNYLISQYKLMHDVGKYRGGLDDDVIEHITALVKKHDAKDLLDYGSGKGRQYDDEFNQHQAWGILPDCYDPAYPPFATLPDHMYDGVICTDVAEHIPENDVPAFFSQVLGFATKFAVFSIDTIPATKMLPDGRNCHLTLKTPEWWLSAIAVALGATPQNLATFTKIKSDTVHITCRNREVIVVFRIKEQADE